MMRNSGGQIQWSADLPGQSFQTQAGFAQRDTQRKSFFMSIGLLRQSFMPACFTMMLSSVKALAVSATIGRVYRSGRSLARIRLEASRPSITGI